LPNEAAEGSTNARAEAAGAATHGVDLLLDPVKL
jgi:hypothetical protein